MIDIGILEAMVADGATAATIVRVVKMMVERETIRRQQWAESQRKTRAKRAELSQVVKYIPSQQTIVDSQQTCAAPLPPKEKSPPPPPSKETNPLLNDQFKRVRAHAYPDDFTLNETDRAAMKQAGWGEAKAAAELSRFKDHALAKRCLYVDWHAAWRNWVRSPFQTTDPKPNGGTNGHHANPAAIRRTSDAVNETLARRQERFRFG